MMGLDPQLIHIILPHHSTSWHNVPLWSCTGEEFPSSDTPVM